MKKLLSVLFAMIIAMPALAMNVEITVTDAENSEPLAGATIYLVNAKTGAITDEAGRASLKDVAEDEQIRITYVGYEPQTMAVQPNLSFNMKSTPSALTEVIVSACGNNPNKGIRTQKKDEKTGECVPTACYEPCYKLKGGKCELQKITGGNYLVISKKCTVTCNWYEGYAQVGDELKCSKDCTGTMTDPNIKKAEWKGNWNIANVKCAIVSCNGKYHPSDDGQSCIPNQGDCTPEQLAAAHAKTGYLLTQQNKCVPVECMEPQYKPEGRGDNRICVDQVNAPCNVKHAKSAKYEMQNGELVCVVVECDASQGYTKSADNRSCIKDCLSTIQAKVPLATKAEYDSTGKCIIKKCGKKDGKKYIPSDDGQTCEETERDCSKETDSKIWPEHATAASYKKSKTGGTAKCVATECETGYDVDGGKCVSVNDSDCDEKPENSKKSHRYYDASTQQTLCIVDECKDGYKVSNDKVSCILESALSPEDAKKRMDELKENAQKMKERENSTENKLLGAAGIGAVGIGGMNIASALSEQSADENAEQDMKAYLATFRCDYGQGRNIVGGETNIQLPGASELIRYTTEYKQLATNLKADKEALGMLPGIESEVIFDSATTGLYDDVSIGTQHGAFTSLSRALLDENSADAAEWQAMKDKTAKKLKTGVIVAGVGAIGTLAGNLAINHGKGDKSGNILDKYDPLKQEIPDITLERIPCSKYPDTNGTGYVPNCECRNNNAYFDEKEMKCMPCGTNERVNDAKNACVCNDGYSRNTNGNCVKNEPDIKCDQFKGNGVTGGIYPNCTCGANATFNKDNNTCECNAGYSNPTGGQCLPTCAGLPGVNPDTANQYNVPNCPCEYIGATFNETDKACYCPAGQEESIVDGQKKCVSERTPCSKISGTTGTGYVPECTCSDSDKEPGFQNGNYGCYCKAGFQENSQGRCVQISTTPTCNDFSGTNGGTYPNCICSDKNATFTSRNGKYGCYCRDGFKSNASGRCEEETTPLFQGNFSSDTTFDRSAYEISNAKCTEIINKIKSNSQYTANAQRSGTLCISAIGHTDTKWFKNTYGTEANKQKNQQLSEQRANAMYNCINSNIRSLFPNATVGSSKIDGKNWQECNVQTQNKDTPECRRVELIISPNRCSN